jgi:hypothetical protein
MGNKTSNLKNNIIVNQCVQPPIYTIKYNTMVSPVTNEFVTNTSNPCVKLRKSIRRPSNHVQKIDNTILL